VEIDETAGDLGDFIRDEENSGSLNADKMPRLTDYTPQAIAEQLTLVHHALLSRVQPYVHRT
jgi:hypothetical protein